MDNIQIKMINEALENQDELTSWESDFVQDLSMKDKHYPLSEKQRAVLYRISKKINFS